MFSLFQKCNFFYFSRWDSTLVYHKIVVQKSTFKKLVFAKAKNLILEHRLQICGIVSENFTEILATLSEKFLLTVILGKSL